MRKYFTVMFALMLLVIPIVTAIDVPLSVIGPDGKVMDNVTVKVIGLNYSEEFTTNSTGQVLLTNLSEGKNYLLVIKGDNFYVVSMIINVTTNMTKTVNATTYKIINVTVYPTELISPMEFYYTKYEELKYTFDAPVKIYPEAISNVTLNFQKEINKGIYSYKLSEIKYDNKTTTNSTIELTTTENHDVTVEYIKTINTLIALLVVGVIALLIILALRTTKTATTMHMIKDKFEFVRRK